MFRLDWVYQKGKSADTGFNKVLEILAYLPREMFREQLVIVLAEHCKDECQKSVVKFGLIPFIIYLVAAQFYLNYYLVREKYRYQEETVYLSKEFFWRCLFIPALIYQYFWFIINTIRKKLAT